MITMQNFLQGQDDYVYHVHAFDNAMVVYWGHNFCACNCFVIFAIVGVVSSKGTHNLHMLHIHAYQRMQACTYTAVHTLCFLAHVFPMWFQDNEKSFHLKYAFYHNV
jgi:hypothetical protein